MLKVAQYAAQLEKYDKAIEIYEEVNIYLFPFLVDFKGIHRSCYCYVMMGVIYRYNSSS